jgi:hypothetical protein
MEDQIRNRIKELVAQRDQILGQINQNTTQRQQLEAAYQQTAGAIAGPYEFSPDAEVEAELESPGGEWPARSRAGRGLRLILSGSRQCPRASRMPLFAAFASAANLVSQPEVVESVQQLWREWLRLGPPGVRARMIHICRADDGRVDNGV